MSPDPIPLFDLRLTDEDVAAVTGTLRSGWLTQGPRTAEFEEAFARRLGVRHAVAVSSATGGLTLAYRAAGVGPGDEVIVPSYTFVATAAAATSLGATPVFADIVSADDLSIDPAEVVARFTPRTRAVVAVHMAGYAAPVDELRALCADRGVALIEDASHAPGAALGGQALGTFGVAGVFSFFPNKLMGIGEGGMVVTDDGELAEACRTGRSHGLTTSTWDRHRGAGDYDVQELGFNFRMDEPRAALGRSRLAGLDAELQARRAHVRAYRDELADVPGLSIPYRHADLDDAACYVMAVLVDRPDTTSAVRSRLREEHAIATSHHYPPVHRLTAMRRRYGEVSLPRTEDAAAREITLPLFPHMTPEQRGRVCAALRAALA